MWIGSTVVGDNGLSSGEADDKTDIKAKEKAGLKGRALARYKIRKSSLSMRKSLSKFRHPGIGDSERPGRLPTLRYAVAES